MHDLNFNFILYSSSLFELFELSSRRFHLRAPCKILNHLLRYGRRGFARHEDNTGYLLRSFTSCNRRSDTSRLTSTISGGVDISFVFEEFCHFCNVSFFKR